MTIGPPQPTTRSTARGRLPGLLVRYLPLLFLAVLGLGLTADAAVATAAQAAPGDGLPADWVNRGSGCFYTADPTDYLCYVVQHGGAAPAVVDFRLQGQRACLWQKTLFMPDGEGNQWPIYINPSAGVFANQNGLWAFQVHNHQHLSLWKAGFFGVMYKVLEIGDLDALTGGDLVTFTWLRDSASCHE